MCRMSVLAATSLLLAAAPLAAHAKDKPKPAPAAAAAQSARTKASPADRAMAERLDPLARAAFWARESDVDPQDVQAGLGLSRALRALGKYEEAAAAAERLRVMAPGQEEVLLEIARAHIGRGQGFYAIEPAQQAAGLAPRDWRPATLLAVAFEQAQRDDEALAAHRQALALGPQVPAVLVNYAMFQAGHGAPAEAEKLLRTAAALPGAGAQVRQNLALVIGLQGRFDEAERLARQDLPPELVASNMAFLRAAAAGGTTSARSWEALRATP